MWGAIAQAAGQIAGSVYNDYRDRKAQKREYKYNSWLQEDNQAFQKYMAENAHQMEMADLQAAGLNPALTATGSSAGSIAGSSAGQSTSDANAPSMDVGNIVENLNNLRTTNANITKTTEETKAIPQQLSNDATNAKANLITAEANKKNAETQEKLAESGKGGQVFGTENGGLMSSILAIAAPFIGGGLGMGAVKGMKALKSLKAAKGFDTFLKSLNSAK